MSLFGGDPLWFFRPTPQDRSGAEKYAYHPTREYLLYQNVASPWLAHIQKNMAPMRFIALFEGPQIMVYPAVLQSGYGGLAVGQVQLQPLQNSQASSGGL